MKPKMKPHVHYAPTSDGVFIRSWSHEFVLKGKNMYEWMERLVPFLNGEQTIEQLTARLSQPQKQFIERLLHELVQRSVVIDAAVDMKVPLAPEELGLYKQTILFLEDQTNEGRRRFQAFRRLRVALLGSGISFKALVRSLVKMGLRRPVFTSQSGADVKSLIDEWMQKDTLFEPVWQQSGDEDFFGPGTRPDLVVWVSDDYEDADVKAWIERCSRSRMPLLIASSLFRHGVVGPIMDEHSKSTWLCLLDRWITPETKNDEAAPPSFQMMVGNIAAMEVLKYVCELPESGIRDHVVTLEPEHLESRHRRLFASPLRSAGPDSPQEALALFRMRREEEPLEQFLETVQASVDERIGILCSLHPGDLKQIPLSHMMAHVQPPGGIPHLQTFIGWGETILEATERAIREALTAYARSVSIQIGEPDLMKNGVWANGRSYGEWLGRGILAALTAEAHQRKVPVVRLDERTIPWRTAASYAKMLELRFGVALGITERVLHPECGSCITVWDGSTPLWEAAGRTQEEALMLALQQSVSLLQLKLQSPCNERKGFGNLPSAIWREQAETLMSWADWTAVAERQLDEDGRRVVPLPWLRDQAIYDWGLLVGQVQLLPSERRERI
ncbi:hypothetical protein AB6A23_06950 [Paenibacillus tarimensis]